MAGLCKKPTAGGQYQAWFTNWAGKRQFITFRTAKEALRIARRLEDEHRQIRLGYRPVPSSAQKYRNRPVAETISEYMDWGATQGGRNGRAWSQMHGQRRAAQLAWWEKTLHLSTLGDLIDVLPQAEKALRSLLDLGRAGKTVANYAEALQAFCNWSIDRGYLEDNPLKALNAFDTTPRTKRRLMAPKEITQLLDVAPPHRRLLYETAFASGLRANELRQLTVADLDEDLSGVVLDPTWTKNRKAGFQPLPYSLVKRLASFAASGEVRQLFKDAYRRGQAKSKLPADPLLYVPTQTARTFDRDLKAAGIPKHNPKGRLDFHAARVSYINMLLENGDITPKEMQELARHATLDMTIGVYGRTRTERLRCAVERVGEIILPPENCVPSVYRQVVGAEPEIATPYETEGCDSLNMAPAVGLEPTTKWLTATRSAS